MVPLSEVGIDAGDHHSESGPPPPGPWDSAPIGNTYLAGLFATRADATAALTSAQTAAAVADGAIAALESEIAALDVDERVAAERHKATTARFQSRVAASYVHGSDDGLRLPTDVDIVGEADKVVLSGAVSSADRALADRYQDEREDVTAEVAGTTDELVAATQRRDAALRAVAAATEALSVIDARITLTPDSISGFVFPVWGESNFISSFGFCRDGCARSHKGNDIFAVTDTPVVAVEDGWVERVGTNRLGGLVVWTRGRSGYRYYYAHLASIEPTLVVGQEVSAGTLLGGVGQTGNAVGTPPHLHFEIHPQNRGAIDPYPVLINAPQWVPPTPTPATPPAPPS